MQRQIALTNSELIIAIALEMAIDRFEREFAPPPQYIRATPKINRNDICTCGSGKKYKKCCEASA